MKVQTMKNWFARVGSVALIGTTFGVIGGLGGYAALSYAAGQNLGGANDYQIPYQGMLELSGEPVDGPTEFVFTLYKSKDSLAPADKLWTSNPRTLQVSRGYFATVLGDETDIDKRLTSAVMAENILYIGMTVDGVELTGRQRILAVPYAQNGAPGKNFVVDGRIQTIDLAVLGNATVNGSFRAVGASTLSGGLIVSGTTTLGSTTNINGTTNLNGSINVGSNASVSGSLNVSGDITASGSKLVQLRYYYLGGSTSTSTEFRTADWDCIAAGVQIDGDIQEDNSGRIIAVHTKPGSTYWEVVSDFRTHNSGFTARTSVACFSKKISNRTGSWF